MHPVPASPKLLVAPLDWGLGHATRCVPIVRELLHQGCSVWLAADGPQRLLLQQEFPQLPLINLPGYRIQYASSGWGLAAKIVAQIPKLLSAIKQEQAWLQKVVDTEGFDAVISDNRYGLYHPSVPSVFVTHQLRIKAPVSAVEAWLQRLNYQYINRFSACWVPDAEGPANLAGELAHPQQLPQTPVRYIGPLSRFSSTQATANHRYLLVLLSGPEPQRSLLEAQLLQELLHYPQPVVLVRGLPGGQPLQGLPPHVTVHAHLSATDLEGLLRGAALVISRSGYSTVMDLAALQKRSILIPTPGQTEQEYLAAYLHQQNRALCLPQKKFRLLPALALAEQFWYKPFPPASSGLLRSTVRQWMADCWPSLKQ